MTVPLLRRKLSVRLTKSRRKIIFRGSAFCALAKRAGRGHISGMSKQSPGAKFSPQEAAIAALCVAQKLAGCNDAALHAFLDRHASLADAPHDAALAVTRDIIGAAEGLDTLLEIVAASLSDKQSATVYMLCADFIAQNGNVSPEEMRLLERLGETLALDRLSRAAFDRAAQARAAPLTGDGDG